MYQLTCPTALPDILDTAEWKSEIQLKEQAASFRTNNNSKFAQNLLYNGHAIGPVEDLMKVLQITKVNI